MTDKVERMDPRCDGAPDDLWMEYRDDGNYVRATDYDALAADFAAMKADLAAANSFIKRQAASSAAAEAALPAVYRLALEDAQGIAEMHRDQCGLDQDGCLYVSEEAQIFASAIAHEIAGGVFNTPTPKAAELMARIKEGKTDD